MDKELGGGRGHRLALPTRKLPSSLRCPETSLLPRRGRRLLGSLQEFPEPAGAAAPAVLAYAEGVVPEVAVAYSQDTAVDVPEGAVPPPGQYLASFAGSDGGGGSASPARTLHCPTGEYVVGTQVAYANTAEGALAVAVRLRCSAGSTCRR